LAKRKENVVETMTQERATRAFEQSTMLAGDATVAAERVLGDLTEFSIVAAKENARLVAELQMAAIDALHESHAAAVRWQTMWPTALMDPPRLCQRALVETIDSTQRALTYTGASARVVLQAVDRLQATATDTGRRVRETLASASALWEPTRHA